MRRESMMVVLTFLCVVVIGFTASSLPMSGQVSPSAAQSAKLTNADVVQMTKAGLSADIILAKIHGSACNFDTSPTALETLKSAGVAEPVILAIVKSSNQTITNPKPAAAAAPAPPPPPETRTSTAERDRTVDQAPPTGCIAVKPIGSHAFRNIMLVGVAGALISKQQYQVVDVVGYPARIGQKFHGNDLQTIQSSGTKVVILEKHYSDEDLHKACHN